MTADLLNCATLEPCRRLDLVSIPPWNPFTGPYLSLPTLAGYMRKQGVDVQLVDGNILCFRDLLSPAALARAVKTAETQLRDLLVRTHADPIQVAKLQETVAIGPRVVERFAEALQYFKSGEFSPREFAEQSAIIELGARIHNATTYPWGFSPLESRYLAPDGTISSLRNLIRAAVDPAGAFSQSLRQEVLPRLRHREGVPVGLSVVFPDQMIPALHLARLIKEDKLDAVIITGGPAWLYACHVFPVVPELFDLVDFVVIGEGELPLSELLRQGLTKVERDAVFYRDNSGRICGNARLRQLPTEEFCTPDFEGLQLDAYFNRRPVLPYQMGRGCYFDKCTFCSQAKTYGRGYRVRAPERVVDDLKAYSDRWECSEVKLVDEAALPHHLRKVSQAVLDRGLDVVWYALARSEKGFKEEDFSLFYAAGCRLLSFGVELGSPYIQELMAKRIDIAVAERVNRWAHAAGIWVHNFFILGFPGESDEDLRQTLLLIDRSQRVLDSTAYAEFAFERHTPVFDEAHRFGIELVPGEDDEVFSHQWRVRSGINLAQTKSAPPEVIELLKAYSFHPAHNHTRHNVLQLLRQVTPAAIHSVEDERAQRWKKAQRLFATTDVGLLAWAEDLMVSDTSGVAGTPPGIRFRVVARPASTSALAVVPLDLYETFRLPFPMRLLARTGTSTREFVRGLFAEGFLVEPMTRAQPTHRRHETNAMLE